MMTKKRKSDLIDMLEDQVLEDDHMDYSRWDHLISDGIITEEEYKWMRESLRVMSVRIKVKE